MLTEELEFDTRVRHFFSAQEVTADGDFAHNWFTSPHKPLCQRKHAFNQLERAGTVMFVDGDLSVTLTMDGKRLAASITPKPVTDKPGTTRQFSVMVQRVSLHKVVCRATSALDAAAQVSDMIANGHDGDWQEYQKDTDTIFSVTPTEV